MISCTHREIYSNDNKQMFINKNIIINRCWHGFTFIPSDPFFTFVHTSPSVISPQRANNHVSLLKDRECSSIKTKCCGTSLVLQGLRICLPVQRAGVRSLLRALGSHVQLKQLSPHPQLESSPWHYNEDPEQKKKKKPEDQCSFFQINH